MSIPIDRLSLLSALTPLRQTAGSTGVQSESGFADKFDKALGNGNPPDVSTNEKARELAQSLTLQMLQSSLSLAGDSAENPASSGASPFSTANSLVQAYRANLAEKSESSMAPSVSAPSQLQELQGDVSSVSSNPASLSRGDTSIFDSIISKASRKYGVDAGLIKAVIKAESNFNPQAVSHAGAQGLMQLMPATARSLGVGDSFDPEQNVMAGTRFLKDLLQRYNGDVDSALAAYNWGPGNVDRRPDRLPRETRDYLVRVKQLFTTFSS